MILHKIILSFILLNQTMNVEVAVSLQERQTGMMYRQTWGDLCAMLFIQPYADDVSFWMKNTALPMTIVYIDPDWNLLEKYEGIPYSETPIPSRSTNVLYILEINHHYTNFIFKNYKEFSKKLAKEVAKKHL